MERNIIHTRQAHLGNPSARNARKYTGAKREESGTRKTKLFSGNVPAWPRSWTWPPELWGGIPRSPPGRGCPPPRPRRRRPKPRPFPSSWRPPLPPTPPRPSPPSAARGPSAPSSSGPAPEAPQARSVPRRRHRRWPGRRSRPPRGPGRPSFPPPGRAGTRPRPCPPPSRAGRGGSGRPSAPCSTSPRTRSAFGAHRGPP